MQTISIQSLSIFNDYEGNTYMTAYPDQIVFNSKELMEVIERKNDYLIIGKNTRILLKDILLAIHNFPLNQNSGNSTNCDLDTASVTTLQGPKRPTNAFILYNNALRKKIKKMFPSFTNSETSKFLGAMWKTASKDIRDEYIQKAIECRRIHKKRYPNFEYNLKKGNPGKKNPGMTDIAKDNWEDYFDWCFHNATGQSFSGLIQIENTPQLTSYNGPSNDKSSSTSLNNSEADDCSLLANQGSGDWSEVYDIVSQFFPEDSKYSTSIDEELWFCLEDFGASSNHNDCTAVNKDSTESHKDL
jgi:hypothetical protein